MKVRHSLFLLFFVAVTCLAQTTTFTGTVTDPDGQVWANAPWDLKLVNPFGGTPVDICGGTLHIDYNGSLDATGSFAGSFNPAIPKNTCISPGGTYWTFTIQPHASVAPFVYSQPLTLSTTTFNLGTPVSAVIKAPRFEADFCPGGVCANIPATSSNAMGYRDAEAYIGVQGAASAYYNVTLECERYWNTTTLSWYCGTAVNPSAKIEVNGVPLIGSPPNLVDTSSVAVTNPSAGVIHFDTSGGGSVPYNPTTTNYIFASWSGLYDDGHALSTAVPVATWTSAAGVCTVNTSSSHNLVANNYVDVTTMTGFTSTTQAPGNGSFQVVSAPTTTQFTFASATKCVGGSGSGGNIYDADYWGIYQSYNQPFLKGHGTLYGVETPLANLNTDFSTVIAPLCALTPGPNYLIIEAGQNDLESGSDAGTMEPQYQNVWAQAHAAGCQVIQGSLVGASYNTPPTGTYQFSLLLNEWLAMQGKTFTTASNGQYWDRFIDFDAYQALTKSQNGVINQASFQMNPIFAQRLNMAFSNQSSSVTGPFPMYGQDGGNGIAFDLNSSNWNFYDVNGNDSTTNWNNFMQWNRGFIVMNDWFNSQDAFLQLISPRNTQSCSLLWGYEDIHNYDSARLCFNRVSQGSASSNYGFLTLTGDNGSQHALQWYGDGHIVLPQFTGGGNQGLGVDNTGKIVTTSSTAPAWVTATAGSSSGAYYSYSCTVNGTPETCYEELINTGALNNATTTTVSLLHAFPTGILGDPICTDNSGRVQTGNTQPVGANFVGLSAPYSTFFAWTGATGENASCTVKGY